jgi:hypothetical protein
MSRYILRAIHNPTSPPIPLKNNDVNDSVSAPHSSGISPPTVEPIKIAIQTKVRDGMRSSCMILCQARILKEVMVEVEVAKRGTFRTMAGKQAVGANLRANPAPEFIDSLGANFSITLLRQGPTLQATSEADGEAVGLMQNQEGSGAVPKGI